MQVTIRPLEKKDALISFKWRNNPEIWKYTGSHPDREITAEIETEWIEKVLTKEDTKRFAILADDIYVGNIQLTNITGESAVFHIFIGDINYWGKGVASKAMDCLFNIAINELALKTITLTVHPDNFSAIKLYEKKGFIFNGINDSNTFLKMLKKL